MLRDFRAFLMKGNVLDLSIAVILGTAFDAIVTALSVAPTTKDRAYR